MMRKSTNLSRRGAIQAFSVGVLAAKFSCVSSSRAQELQSQPKNKSATTFQHACMTLPYSDFTFERALQGIKAAGFEHVAWGVSHVDMQGKRSPLLAPDATPKQAQQLAAQCRDVGLTPLMMFSTIYPEAPEAMNVFKQRIAQAQAASIPQLLTFGHTEGGNRELWIERFKVLGPIARDHGVTIVIKQHGGSTGTGVACADIVREVDHPNVFMNYDAGNVMDYLDVDPIPDLQQSVDYVRSFCIKDHRNWPKDQDCGPGFGEIDHYRLLAPIAFSGLTIPLAYENISAPLQDRPISADTIDRLACRALEYLKIVIAGLQTESAPSN